MCSNIPASPAYGVYIWQLIRYARASSNYSDFLKRHLHLRNRLLDQGYKKIRLIRSLKKFMGTIRTHWYADDLLKQCTSKGDKYVIDEELQHTDHLFLGVACFTFMNFV
jgi:heme oxygenase